MKKKKLGDFNLVIFGGDGDLAFKKLFPALYYRLADGQIRKESAIFVVSINDKNDEIFRAELADHLRSKIKKLNEKHLAQLCEMTSYYRIDLREAENYKILKAALNNSEQEEDIYYYSTPSSIFTVISKSLHENGMIDSNSKVVLEKPLGSNLESFEQLNKDIRQYFKEYQIYRIDHYLGKETVQNLMVLRFANHLFELAWNAKNIDYVEITVAESIGVGSRAGYYDKYGALKDMVQNHLLQLLCLVAMEPPAVLNADNVRNEKLKVLQALKPFTKEDIQKKTVKGQYTRGQIDGEHVRSYQEDVDGYDSNTETFVALQTYVQNWRWAGVPFYLRTGKRMPNRYSEIVINFKHVPHNVFPHKNPIDRNRLIIRLQPEEHIELVQMAKIPGPGGYRYRPISLELDYSASIGKDFPDAYERLLMDVVRGNQTLFMREDEVRAAWEWTHSITDNWEAVGQELELYKAGTYGPSDDILEEGHEWNKSKFG
jgi:glucose-6-phosphate 1-dehydrogenase